MLSGGNTMTSTHLTIEAATKAAQATLDAAEKENQRVSVAVVDRNGNTLPREVTPAKRHPSDPGGTRLPVRVPPVFVMGGKAP
ncbi:hypothetical protein GCM10010222_15910 [Streptomyces tanashiensis]|nr:hypothetical protein GCM10010222_15910 [Streptomyces tanashiensis]